MNNENEGAPVGGEFQVNTYTTSTQWFPTAAMDASGNFVIAWESYGQDGDNYGIFAQRFNSNGNPVGSEFQVNTYTTDIQWAPSAAMNSTGHFVIVWTSWYQDGSGRGVYGQRYDNNGNPIGPEFQVNTFTTHVQEDPSVAMDHNGNFVVVWHGQGTGGIQGIHAQRYDNNGNTLGSQFRVTTNITSQQQYPAVAMDSTGNFVVAWESDGQDGDSWGVYAQRYDNSGNALGGEFQVNTYTTDMQGLPSVVMNATGYFIIAWDSFAQDGHDYGIYAQRYDNLGNPLGAEFQVNTYTIEKQRFSSIAVDSEGNFVIAWSSWFQDGNEYGIYTQRYASSGTPLGTEFQVNTYTISNQNRASIAMTSTGYFVIAWHSDGQDKDGHGIYAQLFDNKLPIEISNVQVLDITDTSARVTWDTDIPANSTVDYGFTTAYGLSTENSSLVISHEMDLIGLEPGRLYHFRVISYNNSINYSISIDLTFTTKFPIDLEPGWNMISIPLNQTDTDLRKVFESIAGDYDAVQCYDVTDATDPWKHNHTGKPPALNDLDEINRFKGIWIHITNPLGTTLYVNGTAPEIGYVNQITLHNGWNFMGYPSLIERTPDSSGLPTEVDMVQWYNASSGSWEYWDPGGSPDTLDILRPGQGLWIHYTGATDVWALEYVN